MHEDKGPYDALGFSGRSGHAAHLCVGCSCLLLTKLCRQLIANLEFTLGVQMMAKFRASPNLRRSLALACIHARAGLQSILPSVAR